MSQVETKKSTTMRQVYTIVERNGKSFWIRIGAAFTNRDGSEAVYLDALPVNGRIQIRAPENRNGGEQEAEAED